MTQIQPFNPEDPEIQSNVAYILMAAPVKNLTEQEVLTTLRLLQLYPYGGHCWLDEQRIEAIGMAIKALQEEPVSDDLEEAAHKYADGENPTCPCEECLIKTFKAGAKWREEQDQSTIELAEDHAMLAGMEKMREQMMAKAVEAKVIPADLDETQFCLSDYDEVSYITAMVKAGKLKLLDKVKLVIVKED